MADNDSYKWINSDLDYYDILGIKFEACTEAELRRAYRKTALKYHPDKVGPNFDPEKYEIFQAAYQVLGDSSLKSQYDQYRHARIQRQRANALFEGKRRQMKEDLEAREKKGISGQTKRSREDEKRQAELQPELKRLAEEGRKRRAARASTMAENAISSLSSAPLKENISTENSENSDVCTIEDNEIKRIEQKIREVQEAKAKRKADRKARKSGFQTLDNKPSYIKPSFGDEEKETPDRLSGISRGLKPNESFSNPPTLSPSTAKSKNNDFTATMARLRAAEKLRLETHS